jgi:hypothetical protein
VDHRPDHKYLIFCVFQTSPQHRQRDTGSVEDSPSRLQPKPKRKAISGDSTSFRRF